MLSDRWKNIIESMEWDEEECPCFCHAKEGAEELDFPMWECFHCFIHGYPLTYTR